MVCGDIIGLFELTTNKGYKYSAVFVSAFGHKAHVYPMQRKNEFLSAFQHLELEYDKTGHKIERFYD